MYLNIHNSAATRPSLMTYNSTTATSIPRLYIDRVTFSAFSSTLYGAVLYSNNSIVLTLSSCVFINSISGTGGSFYFNNSGNSSIIFTDSTFINNKAQAHGGVIYLRSTVRNISVLSSTFYGNSALTGSGKDLSY